MATVGRRDLWDEAVVEFPPSSSTTDAILGQSLRLDLGNTPSNPNGIAWLATIKKDIVDLIGPENAHQMVAESKVILAPGSVVASNIFFVRLVGGDPNVDPIDDAVSVIHGRLGSTQTTIVFQRTKAQVQETLGTWVVPDQVRFRVRADDSATNVRVLFELWTGSEWALLYANEFNDWPSLNGVAGGIGVGGISPLSTAGDIGIIDNILVDDVAVVLPPAPTLPFIDGFESESWLL